MILQKASQSLGRTLTSANRHVRSSLVGSAAAQRGIAGYAENVSDLIGQTPMVKLNRVLPENMVADKILLKLEMQNPGGSIKDRIALSMIVEAEKRGEIAPGKTTIVEATSGNTGIGLAMVAAARGYKCIIAMPQVPAMYERYIIDRKFGAEVHLVSVNKDNMEKSFDNMVAYAKELCAANPDTHWMPAQFVNVDNPKVHYETTGPEIWAQSGENIDVFVAGAGTGGTIAGGAKYLVEQNPEMEVVLVEPSEANVLSGGCPTLHGVVGIGANIKLPLIEELAPGQPWEAGPRGFVSEFASALTPEAVQWANRLAAEEGLLVGPSSGAVVKVCADIASRPESAGKTIVGVVASSGIRYVKHPMWEALRTEADAALPVPPDLENEYPILRWKSEDYVPTEK
mmetsp:Transcript_5860/g.14144  ORF Transcript_5860/g.14144 Transcript_5860/m.14144 type:complete len:399 (+) Transcript_5860:178-1374(+)